MKEKENIQFTIFWSFTTSLKEDMYENGVRYSTTVAIIDTKTDRQKTPIQELRTFSSLLPSFL